jgi:hypothetical protein
MSMRRRRATVTPLIRHYCGLIATDLLSWPQVTSRRMFGLTLFYRANCPFVVLPDTKDFTAADRVGFKMHRLSKGDRKQLFADDHVDTRNGASWITFALGEEEDIGLFLRWAEKAYRSCGTS